MPEDEYPLPSPGAERSLWSDHGDARWMNHVTHMTPLLQRHSRKLKGSRRVGRDLDARRVVGSK
jgi:hypothetical protein